MRMSHLHITYHAERPPKLTTLVTIFVQLRNVSKFRVRDKLPEGSTPIFVFGLIKFNFSDFLSFPHCPPLQTLQTKK